MTAPRRTDRGPTIRGQLAVTVPATLAIVATLLSGFGAIQTLRVSSINMAPTLEPDDRVVVRAYGSEPRPGDVIAYRSPFDPEHLQVGRVVGVGGNCVELADDGLRVDGKPVAVPMPASGCDPGETCAEVADDDGECEATGTRSSTAACQRVRRSLIGVEELGERRFYTRRANGIPALLFAPVTVPDGHFFVLSDNRVDERDSRIYGTIPHHAIVGVLSFVYYASDESGIRWDRMSRRIS
jgi:signal peptidase I